MNVSGETEEGRFTRAALASVERAEKIQRVKRVVVSVIAFSAALWWAYQKAGPELGVDGVILTGVALIAAVCTAKVMSLINKNTRDVLQAILELRGRE